MVLGTGKPIPTPVGRDETPSAGINWKLFLLAAGIIGIVFVGILAMQSDGDSVESGDVVDTGIADVGQSQVVNATTESNPILAEEMATMEVLSESGSETGLKLLKRIGPIEFPPYTEGMPVVQTEETSTEGFRVIATVSSRRDTSVSIAETNPEKRIVVLLLLRNEQGNVIESLSREDTETGGLYFLRESRGKGGIFDGNTIATPKYAIPPKRSETLNNAYSWEVLVYIS